MASINELTIQGHVGKDPEFKDFENGQQMRFPVAVSRIFKDKGGNLKEVTDWFKVVVSPRLSKSLNGSIKKGIEVQVKGSVGLEQWQGDDGARHAQMKVVARSVTVA